MRGGRTLLILLALLIPVLYFASKEYSNPAPFAEEKKTEKVFKVEANKIDELTIKAESGDKTTLKKTGSDWQVVAPVDGGAVAADGAEVSGITSNLERLEQQRVIEETAQDLKDYGLAQPRVEVTFKAGGEPQTLQLGAKTPTGGDLYAKISGQKKVFLIPSYLDSTFNRKTFDLREKSALKVDSQKVDSLEVTADGRTMKFAKVNGAWQVVQPADPRGDAAAIDGLVSRVTGAQMKALAPGTDPKEYGLDKPAVTARVGSGSSYATLAIGKSAGEGAVYARDESRPGLFTVESSLLDELKKDAAQYRQKDLFDARSFNTARVEITRGTETMAFERKTEKDKDGKDVEKWKQLTKSAEQKDADSTKMGNLISTVTGARATSFVDKDPGAKPEVTVRLTPTSGGKPETVTFLRSGSDGFATREGTPGFAKVDKTLIDDIIKAVEALR